MKLLKSYYVIRIAQPWSGFLYLAGCQCHPVVNLYEATRFESEEATRFEIAAFQKCLSSSGDAGWVKVNPVQHVLRSFVPQLAQAVKNLFRR